LSDSLNEANKESLKKDIENSKVIPFVGAGVSQSVKMKGKDISPFKSWKDLLRDLSTVAIEEKNKNHINSYFDLDDKDIDFLELADKIKKFSNQNDYSQKLGEVVTTNYDLIDKTSYVLARNIWKLNSNLIITTNYDSILEKSCESDNVQALYLDNNFKLSQVVSDELTKPTVWNIHGYESNIDSIILTTDSYKKLYDNIKINSQLHTLKTLVTTKSLLFIGFGYEDNMANIIKDILDLYGGYGRNHYLIIKESKVINNLGENIKIITYKKHSDLPKLIEELIQHNSVEISEKKQIRDIDRYWTIKPSVNTEFIGRKEDLEKIDVMLQKSNVTLIVNGIGGVGKSEIVRKYMFLNEDKYENIIFLEISEKTTFESLMITSFKEKLELDKDSTIDTVIKRLQNISGKNLFILDNLESKEDFEKLKLLNHNFDLLITTRLKNIDEINQINLDVLNDIDAIDLFKLNYNTDEEISDIVKEYLGNHPLFIKLTAKSLKNGFITLEELKKKKLKDIDIDDEKTFQEHLEDNFNRQYESLKKEDLKELLLMLSLFPSLEIDISVFEICFDDENIKNKLIKLEKNGWLDKKENSFKLHQIIKEYLKRKEELDYEKVKLIFKRVADFINPDDESINANSLVYYIPIIESFLNEYEKYQDEYIIGLNDSLTFLYYSLYKYEKALDIQDRMLELREKLFGKETNEYTVGLNLIAVIYNELGKYKEALELHNYIISIRDNKNELGISYSNISMVYYNLKNNKKAIEYAEKALKLTKEHIEIDYLFLSIIYNNLSVIYQDLKEYKIALEYVKKAIEIRENELDRNHISLARAYNNISTIYLDLKEFKDALYYAKIALQIYEEILDFNNLSLSIAYNNIAHIYKNLKECKKAKEYMEKAKNIFSQYEYKNKERIDANRFIKKIEQNLKLNYKKRGKFCKD
jgi:tetratricopeptide (TPR) repeat protein